MRGMISGKGLSTIEIDLIFGGLGRVVSVVESPTKGQQRGASRDTHYSGRSFSPSSIAIVLSGCLQQRNVNTYPSLRSSRHLGGNTSIIEPMDKELEGVLYSVSPTTLPNSVCLPCSSSARSYARITLVSPTPPGNLPMQRGNIPSVMKNCDSFEFFVPSFAITTSPRWLNRSRGWTSSSNGSAGAQARMFPRTSPSKARTRTTVERLSACTGTGSISSLNEETRNDPGGQCKEWIVGTVYCTWKCDSLPVKNDTVIVSCQLTRGQLQVVAQCVAIHTLECKRYEISTCFGCFLGARHHLSGQPSCRNLRAYL